MKKKISLIIIHLALVLVAVGCLFPWILMLRISLIEPNKFFEMPVDWFAAVTPQHYLKVIESPFLKFLTNSLILSLVSTIIVMVVGDNGGVFYCKIPVPPKR